jgi:uncharacterized protein DUF6263
MRVMSFSAVLVFALSASLPAQDGEKVTLEWKLKKGDAHRYEVSHVMEMDFSGTEITMEMLFGLAVEVTDVSADGVAKIKATYDRVKVSAAGVPTAGEYDSDKDKKPAETDALSLLLSGFVNKSFTMDLNRKGECVKVEGISKIVEEAAKNLPEDQPMAAQMKQNMQKQFADEGMKTVFQVFFGFLPKEPVAAGSTWKSKHSMTGVIGTVAMDLTSSLKEVRAEGKEGVIKMDAKVTVTAGEDAGVFGAMEITDSKAKSEMVWRVGEGILQSSHGTLTLDGTAGGMEFSIVQKMTMKLAPKKK